MEISVQRSGIQASSTSAPISQVVVELVDPNSTDPGTLSGRRVVSQATASVGPDDSRVSVTLEAPPGLYDVYVFGRDSEGLVVAQATILQLAFQAGVRHVRQVILGGNLPPDVTVSQVRLTLAPSANLNVGETGAAFSALADLSDGSILDVTGLADYTVGDPTILSVNQGQVQALAAGTTDVTATFQGVTSLPVQVIVSAVGPRVAVVDSAGAGTQLFSYRLDPSTGTLSLLDTEPVGAAPRRMAADPVGNLVIVARQDDVVSPFSVDDQGLFTALPDLVGLTAPTALVAVDNRLYVGEDHTPLPTVVQAFELVAGSFAPLGGALTTVQSVPLDLALHGQSLFLTGNSPDNVRAYPLAADGSPTGAVLPGVATTIGGAGFATRLAVHPGGTFLVATSNGTPSNVATIPVNLGAPIDNRPLTGLSSQALALTPDGRFIYVLTNSVAARQIEVFSVDAAGGLTALAGFNVLLGAGGSARDLAVDPAGDFLLVTNVNQIEVRPINPDGSLGSAVVTPQPNAVELDILP